jgi:hypothetical protein
MLKGAAVSKYRLSEFGFIEPFPDQNASGRFDQRIDRRA